jgi:hypothetical protein
VVTAKLLLMLSDIAVEVIRLSIKGGDSRIARRLLRCLGLARPRD